MADRPLAHRLVLRRLELALFGTGTALVLGAVILVAAAAFVAGQRGLVDPGAWIYGLVAGSVVLLFKVLLDLADHSADPSLIRDLLIERFGPTMRDDTEATRMARQAIEYRVRLADSAVKAPRALALPLSQATGALDQWLDDLTDQAKQLAALRNDARFQAGMATLAGRRQDDIATQPANAGRGEDTRRALASQAEASGDYVGYVEALALELEKGVASFAAACARVTLALSRSDQAALAAEPAEIARQRR